MRIVSLLPSTTEIAFALGLGDQVVAVTHECDYPPEARARPVITGSALPHEGLSSAEIDAAVSAQVRDQISIYHLDHDLMRQLQPDLVLTQALCEVCAVSFGTVQEAVRDVGGEPLVLSLEPIDLESILSTVIAVGNATDRRETALALVGELRQRIAAVRERVQAAGVERPRVACFEWLDPIFGPGHWLPEMVEIAGGQPVIGAAGQPSPRVAWETVVQAAPEVIVLTCCGFDVQRTIAEAAITLPQRPGWHDLPAVRARRVYAVDGNAFYSRPGPRIVEGLELLAHILHPALFADLPPAGEVVALSAEGAPAATRQ